MKYAQRVERVEPSATIAVGNLAKQLKAEGTDVVDLSVGEPDFDTPDKIKEAATSAMAEGKTGYAPSNGVPALREAIAEKLQNDGVDYGPDNVIVTPGAKQALFETFQSLVDDGDEVVLLDPAWVSYEAMAKITGADQTRVDLGPYDFQLEPALDELEAAVSDETTLLVLNSPNNPSGSVYSRAALEGVRDLAVEYDFTVLADEIYERIVYDRDNVSLAGLDDMYERTVTVNGFSKAYAMTGWRLGYLAAPDGLIDQAGKVQSHSVSSAVNFVQEAGVAALEETQDDVENMVEAYKGRRDLLLDLFDDLGVDVPHPDGAFYMMLPVNEDDQSWCTEVLEEAHVATVPGSAFGTPGYARISYAASKERLQEGVERLADADYL